MPEDVTIVNVGGDVALGVVTNLVVSGYGAFGGARGSLFSPEGNLQISGSLITYQEMFGRGGVQAGDMAGTGYAKGSFLRGSTPPSDPFIASQGLDYVLLGSGLQLGSFWSQGPMLVQPLTATDTAMVVMPVLALKLGAGVLAPVDAWRTYAFVGSGFLSGQLTIEPRVGYPLDNMNVRGMPLMIGPDFSGGNRVMSSGELAAGGSYRLHSQTSVVGAVNTIVATPVYTHDAPANTIGTDGGVEMEWFGHYLNNTQGQQDLYVSVLFGGVQTMLTLSGIPANAAERAFSGRARYTGAGSTGAQVSTHRAAVDAPATTSGIGSGVSVGGVAVTATNLYFAIDSTSAQELRLSLQHGNADPQLRAYVYNVMTRKL